MRSRLARLAAMAASAAALTAGLGAMAAPAALASPRLVPAITRAVVPPAPPVYTDYKTGFVAHGSNRNFRFASVTFAVPLTSTRNGSTSWRVYAQLSTGGHQFDAGMLAIGADTYQAEYRVDGSATVMTLTPTLQPGDVVTASVFFDVAGDQALDFTVSDATTGAAVTIPDVAKPPSGPVVYASVLAHPNYPAGCGGINPVATDCLNSRLVLWTRVHFVAYNGQAGNLTHVFRVAKVIETDDGTADGDLYASPNSPWDNGANAGGLMRP